MAKKKNDTQVIKSNILIDSKYSLSLREMRIVLKVIAKIKMSDKDFKRYRLYINEFTDIVGKTETDTARYTRAKQLTKNLLTRVIELPTIDGIIQTHFFSKVQYFDGKGYAAFTFQPELKPHLLNLKKRFTRLSLEEVLQCRSTYSIRLYEILKSFAGLKKRVIPYQELRFMLDIEEKQYKRFYDFKINVLNMAKKELRRVLTDIYFTYEVIKKGRNVVAIEFNIKEQKQRPLSIPEKKQKDHIIEMKKEQKNQLEESARLDLLIESLNKTQAKKFEQQLKKQVKGKKLTEGQLQFRKRRNIESFLKNKK